MFGVTAEGIKHGAQVGGVDRVLLKCALEEGALRGDKQAPTVVGIGPLGTDDPRQTNQVGERYCLHSTHRVSPGNFRAV